MNASSSPRIHFRERLLVAALAIFSALMVHIHAQEAPRPPRFELGDSVRTNHRAPVWTNPPTGGSYAGQQPPGANGRIIEGPVRSAQTEWWKVDFDNNADGWVMQQFLVNPLVPPSAEVEESGPGAAPVISDLKVRRAPGPRNDRIEVSGRVSHAVYPPSQVTVTVNGRSATLSPSGEFRLRVPSRERMRRVMVRASVPNPRQQTTVISGYLDGSMIYGSDEERANALRAFQGGRLATSEGDLPPLNTAGLENDNDAHIVADDELFLAGDVRSNENVELTAIHTLFVREHNTLADALAGLHPDWSDEELFQAARRLVIAEVQAITYNEFLPALLGDRPLPAYRGYDPNVNAGIATEFSAAAFRLGHTMVGDDIEFFDNDANEIRDELELAEAFFNPEPLKEVGPDSVLKYLATDNAQEIDTQLVEGLRNFLFGPPGAGGLDLASMNIQRGRDHGLPDYNTVRAWYGLPPATAVAEVTSDASLQSALAALYGDPNNCDLWVTALAENHVPGSSVGPTFWWIVADQFRRTRDGDRHWYQRTISGPQLEAIEQTRLSDVIRRNTSITKLQDNVFFFDPVSTLAALTPRAGNLPRALIDGQRSPERPASFSGEGNNPRHPRWGVAGADLLRISPATYADGVSEPTGGDRPSARSVSNMMCSQTTTETNDRNLSAWVYGWGQFIDHDLDRTTTDGTAFDIAVPADDPSFDPTGTGTEIIPFSRSTYNPDTGTGVPAMAEGVARVRTNVKGRNAAGNSKRRDRNR